MADKTYIITGRSIDGTVYRTSYGWSGSIFDSKCMQMTEASIELVDAQRYSLKAELDDKIGHLHIIETPDKVLVRNTVIAYLIEGNSVEDLATHVAELLYEHERHQYNDLVQESIRMEQINDQCLQTA